MAKRQNVWGRKRLAALRMILGGKCRVCGSTERLEFDCIVPTDYRHHTLGISGRATYYWRQARMGNVQVLCSSCHGRKTAMDCGWDLTDTEEANVPY